MFPDVPAGWRAGRSSPAAAEGDPRRLGDPARGNPSRKRNVVTGQSWRASTCLMGAATRDDREGGKMPRGVELVKSFAHNLRSVFG